MLVMATSSPALAAMSAFSFPLIPTWLGIQQKVIDLPLLSAVKKLLTHSLAPFSPIHSWQTDGRTDGRTERRRQPRQQFDRY